MEREDRAKRIFSQLADFLSSIDKSHKTFTDEFYKQYVDPDSSDDELYDHYGRFKQNVKRNSEIAGLYMLAFKSMYGETITDSAKKAAWEFYVEISDRVSAKGLNDGQGNDAAALSSLHSLFNARRDILRKFGSNSKDFGDFSEDYMTHLRNFTEKWHGSICGVLNDYDRVEFRKGLKELQCKTIVFIEKLNIRYGFPK